MPRNRNQSGRGHREHAGEDEHNNNQDGHQENNRENQPVPVKCCMPSGCLHEEDDCRIDPRIPKDAVRVICINENCNMGNWMHKDCFDVWEEHVLNYLRSCGRARSWSEKQRLQNLWTKKGYDLAFKACDCKCGRGHMKKDPDYWPKKEVVHVEAGNKKKKHHKRNDKPMPVMNRGPPPSHHATNNNNKPALRVRTTSVNSTGSGSPPASSSPTNIPGFPLEKSTSDSTASPPNTPPENINQNTARQNDITAGNLTSIGKGVLLINPVSSMENTISSDSASGSIFKRRNDYSVFNSLPMHKRNPYHIKMEDDGPHGNDDARCLILSSLSSYKMLSLPCVICSRNLTVYDRYPLIDGTFFLSPQAYNSNVQVPWDGKIEYLNAACMHCLEGYRELHCGACGKKWDGNTLVLGTMYSYDIFAATPCCQRRLSCKNCGRNILDLSLGGFQFYCEYSHNICCPFCKSDDYHFVKPLNQCFYMRQVIGH